MNFKNSLIILLMVVSSNLLAMQLDDYLAMERMAKVTEQTSVKKYRSESEVRAFVTRFYKTILGREPDSGGLNDWTNQLLSKIKSGADIAKGFIFSPEFTNRNLNKSDYLIVLYRAFFNREPDIGGFNYWISKFDNGYSREKILNGFLYSQEFYNLCDMYGIAPTQEKLKQITTTSNSLNSNIQNCNAGNGEACNIVGVSYDKKKDYSTAKTYYEKGCNLNNGLACSNLGYLYENALGVNLSYLIAKTYFEKSCNLNNDIGCYNLGILYANTYGDYLTAGIYYEKSCNLNNSLGCNNLGVLYQNIYDYSTSKYYYEKSCNLNLGLGCFNLGVLYYFGYGVHKNISKAKEYAKKACNLGYQDGCIYYNEL